MSYKQIRFKNADGLELSATMAFPVDRHPHTFGIFAHCFTCSQNQEALEILAMDLNQEGIAMLLFDFTGLGAQMENGGEGKFNSSVSDLVAAAAYLEENYQAPKLLIGQSLGGAAIIAASDNIPSSTAIATIGTPYSPEDVAHLFTRRLEEMREKELTEVRIANRQFMVRREFLDEIRENPPEKVLQKKGKALLILHSPQDKEVSIDNAAKMYQAAYHPKSFISLDGADHLLSQKKDASYVGKIISAWVHRFISIPDKEELRVEKEVAVRLGEKGYTTEVMMRHHSLTADEPEHVGGNDFGPSPYELVNAGLGSCTAMTLHMYARRKKWDLRQVTVHLDHNKVYNEDLVEPESKKSKIDRFTRLIEVEGDLDDAQRARLLEIANRCPVHRTLLSDIQIDSSLK